MTAIRRCHGGWEASTRYQGRRIFRRGRTKTEARTRLLDAIAQPRPTLVNESLAGPPCGELVERAIEGRRTSERTTAHRLGIWRLYGADITDRQPDPQLLRAWAMSLPSGRDGGTSARIAFDCASWALPLDRAWRPKPRRAEDRPRVYSSKELAALTAAAEADRMGDLLLVALATGLRLGELLALTPDDIGPGLLGVHRQVTTDGVTRPLKTRSSRRDIAIGPKTEALLRARGGPLVWRTRTGRPLARNFVHIVWTRVHEAAGVERRSPHSARHHHLSELLQRGVPIGEVSRRAGHKSVRVTYSTYAWAIPEAESPAMRAAIESW